MKLFQIEDWLTMQMGELQITFTNSTHNAGFEVIRVPGGWIVTHKRFDKEPDFKFVRSNPVFVPEPI